MAKKLTTEKREQLIDALVEKSQVFNEDDRERLGKLEDDRLTSLATNMCGDMKSKDDEEDDEEPTGNAAATATTAKKKEEPTANAAKPKTAQEWLAEAPPEIRSVVHNAMAFEAHQKSELIKRITANSRCKFTKDQLNAKDVNELKLIAELAANQAPQGPTVYNPQYVSPDAPLSANQQLADDDNDMLLPPTINWEKEANLPKTKAAATA